MDNPLKNINLKWWHTMLLTTSFFIFVLSLTVKFVEIENTFISLVSAGTFFIALGEVANQSFQEGVATINGEKGHIHRDIRINTTTGSIFLAIGMIFIIFGLFRLIF